MPSQVCHVDELRSVAFGATSGSYVELGGEFQHPMRLVKIVNNTNGDMIISFDGVTDNDFVPAGGFTLYDVTTNREESATYFVFANGTQVFVKRSSVPTSGSIYMVCLYGQGE